MTDSVTPDDGDHPDDVRRTNAHEGVERRRMRRPALTDEMKATADARAKGICECVNQNCWHFRRCKAPGVTYLPKRSATGVASCSLFCRECARTSGAGGRGELL